ncbi:MAG: hypothetical protein Q8P83_02740 [bacterium]|nr:hypothetical protein [bacterium]
MFLVQVLGLTFIILEIYNAAVKIFLKVDFTELLKAPVKNLRETSGKNV